MSNPIIQKPFQRTILMESGYVVFTASDDTAMTVGIYEGNCNYMMRFNRNSVQDIRDALSFWIGLSQEPDTPEPMKAVPFVTQLRTETNEEPVATEKITPRAALGADTLKAPISPQDFGVPSEYAERAQAYATFRVSETGAPLGHAVVPLEPSADMMGVVSAYDADFCVPAGEDNVPVYPELAGEIYKAMIAAHLNKVAQDARERAHMLAGAMEKANAERRRIMRNGEKRYV